MREETLQKLFDGLSNESIAPEEVLDALRELYKTCQIDSQAQSLCSAIDWAAIYLNPRRSELWGDKETVRDCLLIQIRKALIAQG